MMEKRLPDETLDNAIEVRKTSMEAYMNDKEYFPGLDEVTIQFLEELKQYRAIGTVEECRAAVERMQPKKPIYIEAESVAVQLLKAKLFRNMLSLIQNLFLESSRTVMLQNSQAKRNKTCFQDVPLLEIERESNSMA